MNYLAQDVERNPKIEEKVNEGVVFGLFGLCFFLCFSHRKCLNMSESHGNYLAERKTLQERETENYYPFL